MPGGGAREACGRAALAGAEGVGEVVRRDRERDLRLVVQDGLGDGGSRGVRSTLGSKYCELHQRRKVIAKTCRPLFTPSSL